MPSLSGADVVHAREPPDDYVASACARGGAARAREQTDDFSAIYAQRAGVEGTHTQALRVCGLRHSLCLGQAKTHPQHILSAVALNLLRIAAWLNGTPLAPTRQYAFARFMASLA